MKFGTLSTHFSRVAAKLLSDHEIHNRHLSHYEFGGNEDLCRVFGNESWRSRDARFLRLADEEEMSEVTSVAWDDSRGDNPDGAAQWRLSLKDVWAMGLSRRNDLMVIGVRSDGQILIVVAGNGSSQSQMAHLFGLPGDLGEEFFVADFENGEDRELDLASVLTLESLGIAAIAQPPEADRTLSEMGPEFPSPDDLFGAALKHAYAVDPIADPDGALVERVLFEMSLFGKAERDGRRDHAKALMEAFMESDAEDLDDFLDHVETLADRRLSYVRSAIGSHADLILNAHGVECERNAATEGDSHVDFLFPSSEAYRDSSFPVSRLCVLRVEAMFRAHWWDVKSDAKRIEQKHLLSLEGTISERQSDVMLECGITLVSPACLHRTFTARQLSSIMNVREFIEEMKQRQRG